MTTPTTIELFEKWAKDRGFKGHTESRLAFAHQQAIIDGLRDDLTFARDAAKNSGNVLLEAALNRRLSRTQSNDGGE